MTIYAIADDIAWVSRDEYDTDDVRVAYVSALPHGPTIVLEGSACLIWLAVEAGGTLDDIARATADLADADPDEVVGDVETVLSRLVELSFVHAL